MDKIKYTTYLAGFIESSPKDASGWRNEIAKSLVHPDLIIYDPVEREAQKTLRKSVEHVDYVVGLKKAGKWEKFIEEMNKIWLGNIHPTHDLIDVFKLLRYRKIIDGNTKNELDVWADYEAVIRSDFIVAFMKKETKTVGTIIEIFLAMLFKIPVYLILDAPKIETNSTLLMMVLYSNGEIFYSANDCLKFIKEKYNLETEKKEEKSKEKKDKK